MKRVLIVAATTGYQTRLFAEAAKRLGLDSTLATDRCHVLDDPWGDRALPVRFDEAEPAANAIAQAGPFDGIVAVADRPTSLAALAAAKLGLPFHAPAAVECARDKFLARRRFAAAGLPVPHFSRIRLDCGPAPAAHIAPYPCVLKPLGLSASRGVIRADNPAEFLAAFQRIEAILARPDVRITREPHNRYIQVESYIEGAEYAVEAILTRGRLKVLAIFEKPDPLTGPYFEETIYITPPRVIPPGLIPALERSVAALGLSHGPVHAEFRCDADRAWPLEIAPRPIGGLCSKSLRFTGGMPLEELLLRHAVGEDIESIEREPCASGVMMIPIERGGIYEGVDGLDHARQAAGEIEITAKLGQALEPLPEGSSYLGFIFAQAATPDDVERQLREAHSRLRIRIAPKLPTLR